MPSPAIASMMHRRHSVHPRWPLGISPEPGQEGELPQPLSGRGLGSKDVEFEPAISALMV